MTEKRSDYRRQQSKNKGKKFLKHVRSAFDDRDASEENLDINPEFQRDRSERRSFADDGQEYGEPERVNSAPSGEDKRLRLKKRLNRAILIVFVLIVLVLLALFHL